jgi:hypothetical protein
VALLCCFFAADAALVSYFEDDGFVLGLELGLEEEGRELGRELGRLEELGRELGRLLDLLPLA